MTMTVKLGSSNEVGLAAIAVGHGVPLETARQLAALATGNPGGITVLSMLWREKREDAIQAIMALQLDGQEIWVGYKNLCDYKTDVLVHELLENSAAFRDRIRQFIEKGKR